MTAAPEPASSPVELERQFYDMLMASQFWPAEDLVAYQHMQLTQLLKHAKANVPFYADRLDAVLKPNGEIDWDRWSEIPIVKRSDLSEHGDALMARTYPPSHGKLTMSLTSGTTGTPIKVMSAERAHIALRANRLRAYRWHGIDWSKPSVMVFGEDPADSAWPEGKVLGTWGAPWEPPDKRGALLRISRLTDYANIVEFLERKRPSYLATGPKTATAIALEAERINSDLRIDALLAQGAMVGALETDTMQRVFGARISLLYSSKEAGQIAHGCPEQPGLHVNAESVLLEIVDEQGKPCVVGQPGRVVVTPFFNAAQPLIRYEQGDVAEWMMPCSCGRHLPRIDNLIGRSTGLFYHPDGRVRAGFMHFTDRTILKCRDWQIAQTGPHNFEVRYVPADWAIMGNEGAMADRIREVYFGDAVVAFQRLRELPSRGGKTVEYVNEWLPPGRASS
ncbi:MAG: hypothetical protein ABL879_02090 [Devosia sp.]